MGAGTRLLLFLFFVLFVLLLWWSANRHKREQELLKSRVYADAVKDWERLQLWFVRDFESDFVPFPLMLDTGGILARRIVVSMDPDGKIFIPGDLSPSEFVLCISLLKEHFSVD